MSDAGWTRATRFLFAAAFILVLATFRDYGIAWDEHFHDTYGKAVLRHFESGFTDPEALTYFNLWLYGAAFDVVSALAKRLLPLPDHEVQHLMIACAGLAGAAAAARMGSLAGGARAGFLAGLLLLAVPAWWGHMFINPKDVPFAAAMAWALYWSMRAAGELPRPRTSTVVWLGVSLGLSLGIRIAGLYAIIYPLFAGTLWLALRVRREGFTGLPREFARATGALAAAGAIAYAVMLACWPWALRDPLHRPAEALAVFAATPWDINVLFEGHLVSSMALPAGYLVVYLGVKLPLFVLAALLAATVAAADALRRDGLAGIRPATALLGFAALFPVAAFVVVRPVSYDGIRHFLFVLPPVAALAALGIERIAELAARSPAARAAGIAAFAGIAVAHGAELRALHPYQYVYYNALADGTHGAEGRFELDYWGTAYREAALALDAFVAAEKPDHVQTVFVCAEGSAAAPYLSRDLALARDDRSADFYLSTTRLGCDREYDGRTVASVVRQGALLAVVKDRRALKREAPDRLAARPVEGALVAPRHPGLTRDGKPQPDID